MAVWLLVFILLNKPNRPKRGFTKGALTGKTESSLLWKLQKIPNS